MKIRIVTLFTFIAVLTSCQDKNHALSDEIVSIDVSQQSELSEIFESVEYTILETPDESSLIGTISEIEITGDRIYILDNRKKSVLIFDRQGHYINAIDKRGRGPGEYLDLTDMGILNSTIYVLDRDRIFEYKEDGTWLRTITLNTFYNYFHLIDDRLMYLYSGKSNDTMYDFALFDYRDESLVKQFSPYEKTDSYLSRHSPFYPSDSDELLVAMEYDYNIYSLTDDRLVPKYTLNFNTKNQLPHDYEEKERIKLYEQLATSNVVTRVECMDESEDFIALTFPLFHDEYGVRTHFTLVDRQTKETKHLRLGDKRDSAFPYFTVSPTLIKNGYVVCAMDAIRIINIENVASLSDFKGKISETDNPVLFFYKLKEW